MARLPNPGSDDGTWGAVLNDFLQQSHKTDGTLKPTSLNASGALLASQNLSDVAAAETARTNLGHGTAATYPDTEFNRHRVAKYAHTGEISGFVRMWNPAAWDGGAGDVDVLMVDPVMDDPDPWEANVFYNTSSYAFGSAIIENGRVWFAFTAKGTTGVIEQVLPDPGQVDGNVTYGEAKKLFNGDGVWQPNATVENDDYVIANGKLWRSNGGTTGATEPDWTSSDYDNSVYWSEGDASDGIVDWQPNLTVNRTEENAGYMRFSTLPGKIYEIILLNNLPRSGSVKPVFDINEQIYLDNEVAWYNSGQAEGAVMPYLLGLDASNAVDGRRVTIHFTSNIAGSFGYGGSGYGGSGSAGLQTALTTIGMRPYGQTIQAGYIESTYVLSNGSIVLMWDASKTIWRLIGGGNEMGFNIFGF